MSLALLRIAIPPMMLLAPGFRESVRVAGWDRARWAVPEGLGWFVARVPIGPSIATAVEVVAALAAFHAMLGLRSRPALAVLALSSFYLYSIAQLTGFVWHDMHLLWMCALLAVSPCDHALALDMRRPAPGARAPYVEAVVFARMLLAAIYFFPGWHKLHTSGLAWATSDNLLNQLYWKWLQHGGPPPLRLDLVPWLLKAGGVFTLVFELGFPFLLLTRRTRTVAAAMGLFFHVLSAIVFRISFPSLWICYVVLFDPRPAVSALLRAVKRTNARSGDAAPTIETKARPWPVIVVGCLLVAGAVIQGARGQMASYPFACYPTFQWMAPSEMPDLTIELVSADGTAHELAHAQSKTGYRSQRQWGEVFRLAGVTGPVDRARLRAYFASVARSAVPDLLTSAKSVRFFRVYRSVRPDDIGRPPNRRELLWEASLARAPAMAEPATL